MAIRYVDSPGKGRWLILMVIAACILWGSMGVGVGSAKTTIVYQYNWYTEPQVNDAYLALIRNFNDTHRDIEVKGICPSAPGAYDKLLSAVAGGVAPDVVAFEASSVIEWASKGLLMPLDSLFSPEELQKEFFPCSSQEVIFNDHVWALPFYTDIRGLFWNVDLLEENGIDAKRAPATLQELDLYANKLAKTDSQGKFSQLGFIPWIFYNNWYPAGWFWTFGGDIYDPAKKKPTLDRPENIRAWEWVQKYAQLYPPGRFNLGSGDPFMTGRLGMAAWHDAYIADLKEGAPDLNYRTGPVPYPPGGKNGTWGGGLAHIVLKGTKHSKEALEFAKWLASPEAQFTFYKATLRTPTRRAAFETMLRSIPKGNPVIPILQQVPVAHGRPPLWGKVIVELIQAEVNDIVPLTKAPQDVLIGLQRKLLPEYEKAFGK